MAKLTVYKSFAAVANRFNKRLAKEVRYWLANWLANLVLTRLAVFAAKSRKLRKTQQNLRQRERFRHGFDHQTTLGFLRS